MLSAPNALRNRVPPVETRTAYVTRPWSNWRQESSSSQNPRRHAVGQEADAVGRDDTADHGEQQDRRP
jgi:hypothetical protein